MFVYAALAKDDDYPALRLLTPTGAPALIGAFGGPALAATAWSDTAFQDAAKRLFRLEGNLPPTPEQAQKFSTTWDTIGVVPPGSRIKDGADNIEILVLTETSIELRAPIEVPVISAASGLASARGRVVVSCITPEAVVEANQLRASADPDKANDTVPEDLLRRWHTQWRVVRIESDLIPVFSQRGPGAGGGPGGPDPGGQ
jgi:hypothetical protein